MVPDDCASVEFLLQADLDGELDISGAATLAAHLVDCPTCQAQQEAVSRLSARLRSELPYYAAPARLREAIQSSAEKADLPAVAGLAASSRSREAQPPRWFGVVGEWFRLAFPVGRAAAVLAALALIVIVPRGSDTTDSVIASHIRALQPGHLMDVISTNQHTVKPWFDGKLPPVKDLGAQGFPLVGGRLDFLAGRPVAALVYRRAKHIIDLYVWPKSSKLPTPEATGERSGYNVVHWSQGEMVFWAVSDVEKPHLLAFARLWRSS